MRVPQSLDNYRTGHVAWQLHTGLSGEYTVRMRAPAAPKHVVIVGAGFGGVYAYLTLHRKLHGTGRVEVTLVSPTDTFLFTPLIHEVATGGLSPSGVVQSLRVLPRCCLRRFILRSAEVIDAERQIVHVRLAGTPGDPEVPADDTIEVPYDYLILAAGSEPNFFDVSGAREYALTLGSIADARALKNHVIERFERAQTLPDPSDQKRELSFVIVGGGPTGVELAGELADFVHRALVPAFARLADHPRIVLLERGSELLKRGIGEWFSHRATALLQHKKGVYVLYESPARAVTPEGVATDRGFVFGKTVIWAAGVRARDVEVHSTRTVERERATNRIRVDDHLTVPGYPNVFVVGDQAWACDRERREPYPMRAQFAVREGKHVARSIVRLLDGRLLERFSFREKGFIISLGRGGALARLFGIRFSGPLAWVAYRLAYLSSMVGWRTRLRTALEWMLNMFLPRDIAKL